MKSPELTAAGFAKDLSDVTFVVQDGAGKKVELSFDAIAYARFAQKLNELLMNVQIHSKKSGQGVVAIATLVEGAEAELAPETGNIFLGIAPTIGPIRSYSLSPQLARSLASQLLEQANLAERGGTHGKPN